MGAKQSSIPQTNPFEAVHPAAVHSVEAAANLAAAYKLQGSKKNNTPGPPYAII